MGGGLAGLVPDEKLPSPEKYPRRRGARLPACPRAEPAPLEPVQPAEGGTDASTRSRRRRGPAAAGGRDCCSDTVRLGSRTCRRRCTSATRRSPCGRRASSCTGSRCCCAGSPTRWSCCSTAAPGPTTAGCSTTCRAGSRWSARSPARPASRRRARPGRPGAHDVLAGRGRWSSSGSAARRGGRRRATAGSPACSGGRTASGSSPGPTPGRSRCGTSTRAPAGASRVRGPASTRPRPRPDGRSRSPTRWSARRAGSPGSSRPRRGSSQLDERRAAARCCPSSRPGPSWRLPRDRARSLLDTPRPR